MSGRGWYLRDGVRAWDSLLERNVDVLMVRVKVSTIGYNGSGLRDGEYVKERDVRHDRLSAPHLSACDACGGSGQAAQ